MNREIPGRGRKRPQLDLPVDRLYLDNYNPRFSKEQRGKEPDEVIAILKRYFDLEELAYSMTENGYFNEEPLVATPINLPKRFSDKDSLTLNNDKEYIKYCEDESDFTVVEGNRRLSTVKLLLSNDLRVRLKIRRWPLASPEVREDLSILPVIVYSTRTEILNYMGIRHIAGIKKWESYSRALYIAEMLETGIDIGNIQKQVGDRTNSVRKLYLCYKLVDIAENELELSVERAKDYFSYLILITGQSNAKKFLGLPDRLVDINLEEPISADYRDNLKWLFSWLFGEGTEKLPVIKESRDITNYVSAILGSEEAVEHLKKTRELIDSYEISDGEKLLLIKNLTRARRSIGKAISLITKYKTDDDVKAEAQYCQEVLNDLLKLLTE